ncbi:methyltransferase FkbM [Leptolyngbya sp. NIES-3755]|nr:methyltransferase FkbM [Leptolyngbya sp. NIES-3755]
MNTPIVLLVFNRPHLTERVFERVRQAKPSKLFVVADAPRLDRPDEVKKSEAVKAIIDQVDWDCTVYKNYAETNLGCKRRISSGLDWVFEQVEEAIILEDDCLPDPSFFSFCESLLEQYRDDSRVMMVSGNNFQFDRPRSQYDYYFSRYTLIWGWATWRRAWQKYDGNMQHWKQLRDRNWLDTVLEDQQGVRYWTELFNSVEQGELDTWDVAWTYTCWAANGLSIVPNKNLVSNIGFDPLANNTTETNSPFDNTPTQPIHLPLRHPPLMIRDVEADRYSQKTQFHLSTIHWYKNKLRKWLVKNLGFKTAAERKRLAMNRG